MPYDPIFAYIVWFFPLLGGFIFHGLAFLYGSTVKDYSVFHSRVLKKNSDRPDASPHRGISIYIQSRMYLNYSDPFLHYFLADKKAFQNQL